MDDPPGPLPQEEKERLLRGVIDAKDEEYTWITGEVELVTAESSVKGQLVEFRDGIAVVDDGERRHHIDSANLVNILIGMQSPGPE